MSDDTPSPFRQSIAVVIGIDAYEHGVPALRTAANDARRLSQLLATTHGYTVIELIDRDATHARIVEVLKARLPAMVGADDRVCFYFAGHGVALDGDNGPNGYLLPQDAHRADEATFLHMPLVHDALVALPCRHMLVILDSCFSGAFRWSATRSVSPLPEVIHQERYERFLRDPAWQVIASASQDQEAIDRLVAGALGGRDADGEHSPFAAALFAALEGAGDLVPRSGGDGVITATELYLCIEERLHAATTGSGRQQTPRLWPLAKHDKGEFVFLAPGRQVTLPPAPPLTFDANPWRGLAAYDRGDAGLFFGRETATTALQQAIESKPLVVVLGSSGTGKSSLVRAGVLPQLEGKAGWHVLPVIRPGTGPLESLAQAFADLGAGPQSGGTAAMVARIRSWAENNPDRRLVLVIDQCEELVTMARAASAREAFLQALSDLMAACNEQLTVVLTLRTDFESHFDRSVLAPRWKDARFVVPPLSRADFKAIIEQPASARVLYFEPPSLVDTLLDEVVNTPGGLPLLSFALSEMYVRYVKRPASDRALTRDDYDAVGGVTGALRSRADAEYEGLDEPNRASMQRLMLRMVSGGPGSLARRRVSDAELEFPDAAETARLRTLLGRLTEARLVVQGTETDGQHYAEPAHDALVRGWGRLMGWIHLATADTVPLAVRQRLSTAALEWHTTTDATAKKGLLWSDAARSAMLTPLVRARAPWLNARELSFAERSVRGRRNVRWAMMAAAAAMAVLGAISLVFGVLASRNAAEARAQQLAAQEAAARAQEEEARAEAEADRAEFEKERAVISLFSSLNLYMSNGNAGSVCVQPECKDAPAGDGDKEAWFTIARLPDSVPNLANPNRDESREFIVAREYGNGHVLVYAQDGLTRDDEIRGRGADNLVFAENALRWLDAAGAPDGCPAITTILFWEGTFLRTSQITAVRRFIERRGWKFLVTDGDSLEDDLECGSVLWYTSDWDPPDDFAEHHVPMIEEFVRDGGGLLVGGLGWSYSREGGTRPYAADQLGRPFGFSFTKDAFQANARQPIPLLQQP